MKNVTLILVRIDQRKGYFNLITSLCYKIQEKLSLSEPTEHYEHNEIFFSVWERERTLTQGRRIMYSCLNYQDN